jgi:hypothetical protein
VPRTTDPVEIKDVTLYKDDSIVVRFGKGKTPCVEIFSDGTIKFYTPERMNAEVRVALETCTFAIPSSEELLPN